MSSRQALAVPHVLYVFQADRLDHEVAYYGGDEGDADGGEDLDEHDVRVGFDGAFADRVAFRELDGGKISDGA